MEEQQSWIEEFKKLDIAVLSYQENGHEGSELIQQLMDFISASHQHLLQQVLQKLLEQRKYRQYDIEGSSDSIVTVEAIQAVFQSFGSRV